MEQPIGLMFKGQEIQKTEHSMTGINDIIIFSMTCPSFSFFKEMTFQKPAVSIFRQRST